MRVLVLAIVLTGCGLTQDFDKYSANHGRDSAPIAADATVDPGRADAPITEEEVSLPDVAPVDISVDTYMPPSDTGVPCPAGQVRCGDTCYDVNTDRDHCGPTCASCEAQGFKGAARCVAGKCQCASGSKQCGDTCTYVDSDPLHCGGCGLEVHDSSETCESGSPACAWTLRECKSWSFTYSGSYYPVNCPSSSTCIDTSGEGNFCIEYYASGSIKTYRRCYGAPQIGWCIDNACTYASSTAANPCTAIPNHIDCKVVTSPTDSGGRVRSCVDKMHDPNHCGGCNLKCAGVDELCADGACKKYRPARDKLDCPAGWQYCKPPGFTSSVCIFATKCPS